MKFEEFVLSIDSEEGLFLLIQDLASCPEKWECHLGTGKKLTIKISGCRSQMLWVRIFNYYAQRVIGFCASMYGYEFEPPYWFQKRKEEKDGE